MSLRQIPFYNIPDCRGFRGNRQNRIPDPGSSVLLVHDMQNYFLGFYSESMRTELTKRVKRTVGACRCSGIPVLFSGQEKHQTPESRGLLTEFWGPGMGGRVDDQDFPGILGKEEADPFIPKMKYSAFFQTELAGWMKRHDKDHLLICGIYGHIGCLITAADAFMQDIRCFFIGDAMGDLSLSEHELALTYAGGRCAQVMSYLELEEGLGI